MRHPGQGRTITATVLRSLTSVQPCARIEGADNLTGCRPLPPALLTLGGLKHWPMPVCGRPGRNPRP